MRAAADLQPVRKFVIVAIEIIEEAAFLNEQPARVQARTIAAIPAKWPGPDTSLQ